MNLPERYWVAYVWDPNGDGERWSIEDRQYVYLNDAVNRRNSMRRNGFQAEVITSVGWEVVPDE